MSYQGFIDEWLETGNKPYISDTQWERFEEEYEMKRNPEFFEEVKPLIMPDLPSYHEIKILADKKD